MADSASVDGHGAETGKELVSDANHTAQPEPGSAHSLPEPIKSSHLFEQQDNSTAVGSGTSVAAGNSEETSVAVPTAKPQLSHVEAVKKARELISELLSDPLLSDMPPEVSLDEVKSTLAMEQCKAITLHLRRFDGEVLRKYIP